MNVHAEQRTIKNLLAATMAGVVEHDLRAGTVRYDERWMLILGFDPESPVEVDEELWLRLTHPDDREELEAYWADHVEQGWPFQHTWRMSHAHGGYRWILGRSAVQLDESGTPTHATSFFSDVTERVEASRRHEALVAALPDTVLRVSHTGEVLDARLANRERDLELFDGLTKNRELDAITYPTLRGRLRKCVADSIETKKLVEANWSGQDEDEALRVELELRCTPVGQNEAVCIVRDITDRRFLETQLAQAQRLESIGQLAAGVAHEINTPLQFIGDNVHFLQTGVDRLVGFVTDCSKIIETHASPEGLELLESKRKSSKIKFLSSSCPDALDSAREGVERVAGIVKALKEFSHPGSDNAQPADLNRALQTTLQISVSEWKEVAEVVTEFDAELSPVTCFVDELNQCFLNIIVNAAHAIEEKYGSDKSGRIVLKTQSLDQAVEIRISDNGPGIPEEIRERIYDPFFTTKEVGKGTGQGLSIARKVVVEKHGGQLICESNAAGTTFVIRLPVD
ncbi:MAG: ATP-binding protein [Myxococcota bacterium]